MWITTEIIFQYRKKEEKERDGDKIKLDKTFLVPFAHTMNKKNSTCTKGKISRNTRFIADVIHYQRQGICFILLPRLSKWKTNFWI